MNNNSISMNSNPQSFPHHPSQESKTHLNTFLKQLKQKDKENLHHILFTQK